MKLKNLLKSEGFLYQVLWSFGVTMHMGFFRKVYFHNREGVPDDKPVLLAVNHPTAFVDPLLLCIFLPTPIYNMTRGDIFRKPFFRKLMEQVNMFPVFRVRDGYTEQDRNDAVFDFCFKKLSNKDVVTIYVEGEHHLEKRVRPIQKGIGRIALAAYEKYKMEDLQIIPVGCNYQYGDRARDVAMVNVGAPIFVRDYWALHQENPNRALLQLCRDVENALKTVCYHLENIEDQPLAEHLLSLQRSERPASPLPPILYSNKRFLHEKAVLDRLNALPAAEKTTLLTKTAAYFKTLSEAGIEDAWIMNPAWGRNAWLLLLAFGLPFYLVGSLSSWPLRRLAYWVADTKVKKKEFYGSVIIGVGYLFGLLYYGIQALIGISTWDPRWMALGLVMPLVAYAALLYGEFWTRWKGARSALACPTKEDILQKRAAIREHFPIIWP